MEQVLLENSGVEQPADTAMEQGLLELRELGHWPRRRKHPKSGAEEAENKLRRKLQNHKLEERDQRVLDALRGSSHTHSGDADDLLRQVLQLGCMPRELKDTKTDAQRAETKLKTNLRNHGLPERAN